MSKLFSVVMLVIASSSVLADEHGGSGSVDWVKVSYLIGLALASIGGTRAQSNAAAKALEGIARNPACADKLQTPMIISLALMESLVIFMLISTFLV